MYRFQGLAAVAVLLLSGGASAATAGSDLSAVASSIVDRCYTVWNTVSDSDLVPLEETLRRELRAQAAAVEAQSDSAEAEIALLEGRLALLNAGLGEGIADAAAQQTVGAPTQSSTALGKSIVTKDVADTAAEIGAVEAQLAEAQARLSAASLQQLRLPAYESGLSRCIDYHRARMGGSAPAAVVTAPAPALAPAPAPAAAPEPTPPPVIVKAAAAPSWSGTLGGWYEGECVAQGTPTYDFRQPLRFTVDEQGTVDGRVWWGSLPQRAGEPVTETTAHSIAGVVDTAGELTMSAAWKGTLSFEGRVEPESAQGTMLWQRPFETCRGVWSAD